LPRHTFADDINNNTECILNFYIINRRLFLSFIYKIDDRLTIKRDGLPCKVNNSKNKLL